MSNKVKCSHILVEKQSQALEILEEIKNGKKFGAAAKEISTCPSSKKEGDLGYFTKGNSIVMTVLNEQTLNDILQYLEKSINSLVLDGLDNLEINGGEEMKNFLENQFDIRLENLLISKNSSIHHLESGMKNLVIQKKQEIISKISKQLNN